MALKWMISLPVLAFTIIMAMGLAILILRDKTFEFSWAEITTLGVVASFNKGISGGDTGR